MDSTEPRGSGAADLMPEPCGVRRGGTLIIMHECPSLDATWQPGRETRRLLRLGELCFDMLTRNNVGHGRFQVLPDVTRSGPPAPRPPRQGFRCSGSARAEELAHSGVARAGRPGRKGTEVQDSRTPFPHGPAQRRVCGLSEADRSVLMVTRNSYPPCQHYCGSLPSCGQQSVPSSLVQKMRPARTSLSPRLERSGQTVVAFARRNKL